MAEVSLPLTFEKGLLEGTEESMHPPGFASRLENWVPEPGGNLRCRVGWNNTGLTGAPATRRTRGIGRFHKQTAYGPLALVQSANNGGKAVAGVTVTLGANATANNLMVATVTAENTITTPADWTLAVTLNDGARWTAIYYRVAPGGVNSVAFTLGAAADVHATLMEFSGTLATSPLDTTNSAQGTAAVIPSSTITTGPTGVVAVGAVHDANVESQTGVTNGYTQVTNNFANVGHGTYYKEVSPNTSTDFEVTTATSANYVSAIASFKLIPSGSESGFYLVAHSDASSSYEIFRRSASDLTTAWSSVESVNVGTATTSSLVAFAAGLSNVVYGNHLFSALRRWDGASASAISGSPAGRALAFHKNRFFVGGTLSNPTRLWYSDLGSYATWGTNSYIDINLDDGEPIEDLVTFEDGLLIAKRNSLWFLSGSGPSDFSLHQLNAGGGAAGRSLIVTPYGAVIAGRKHVYLWAGGGVETISKPVETNYGITGNWLAGAYADGFVYIADEGSGTIWAFNIVSGTWHTEKTASPTTEGLVTLFSHDNNLLGGPKAATSASLLEYRQLPGSARDRDENLAQSFVVHTSEIYPEGPDQAIVPKHLMLRLRQRGGTASQTGLGITATYRLEDGSTVTRTDTVTPKASAVVFRHRWDCGRSEQVYGFKFEFSQTVASNEAALMDIEEAIFQYEQAGAS